ncbi:pilus assembly protein TadG-related protein [Bradyrhizobium septentrionale]|uniref:pilus assembly protein TadG-related protein n=1 Tax=Bradyrhizobium septentrionale TaxID=1404411 RepID=UPI0030D039B4
MLKMLRCRRGSTAFATVVALVPLVGAMALGGEAGSWYVTKQRAQNAADAAAYSGGLWLACSAAGSSSCPADAQTMDYRGKQYASQNAFCNAGDSTTYPGSRCITLASGTSQSVAIAAEGSDSVRATVGQTQPAYLAKLLGLSTVTINATAVARVIQLANPCVLSLVDPLSFQGSTTVTSPNCGLASNSTASNSLDFTGNGLDVSNAGSISGQGGCAQTGGSQCSKAITYSPAVPDPLSGLNAAISALTKASFTGGNGNGACSSFKAYGPPNPPANTTDRCYNTTWPSGDVTLNGVYFLTGDIKINGGPIISGTGVTLILLPPKFLSNGDKGASLTITGNPTIQLTAPDTVTTAQVPPALASVVGLMSKLLIYDPEPYSKNGINISGNTSSYFKGVMYVPNTPVTYTGSATSSGTCTEVIAYAVTLSGNSSFDNSGCPASSKIVSKYVRLVQ